MAWCANGHWQEGVSSHHISACPRCAMDQRTARLAPIRDAVVEAAISKAFAVRVWKASGGWNAPREVLRQVDTADEEIIRAVEAYLAALEG